MKRTVFYNIHKNLGAKMVPFAGFEMPVQYKGINHEHFAVRNSAGIFDVSHMGEFWFSGINAGEFIQELTANDVYQLSPGKAQYSCLLDDNGGIVDDILIYQFENDKYMMVVNAANIDKDFKFIIQNNKDNKVEIENASENMSLLAIQGPKAHDILQKITEIDLSSIPFYTFKVGSLAGVNEVIISATGYTGAGGFEIYFNNKHGEQIWKTIMKAGEEFGIEPAGLGARDTLRLEMGFCLYGNDMDESKTPIEAGLSWLTKLTDNNPFPAKEKLIKQKENGVSKRLRAFVLHEKGIPRKDYTILNANGGEIGIVTSGAMSPILQKGIGMGYILSDFKIGDEIYIAVRNKKLKAKIVKPPFIK